LTAGQAGVSSFKKEPIMPAVPRIDPKNIFSAEEWRALTSRSSLRGILLVAHAWGTIIASIALLTLWPNPLTWLVAVIRSSRCFWLCRSRRS
jgi:hypothetical protein